MDDEIFTFQNTHSGQERLDRFLVSSMPDFSRARLQNLIREGCVLVNGAPAKKSGQLLEAGTMIEIRIPVPASVDLVGEEIPLDIVFENDDLIVINKPAGMVVHPAAGHASGTLVHAVLGHDPGLRGIGGEERPGVVHRLDKDTSGLIILAKDDKAHRWLQDQFRLRQVDKTYLALVDGRPPTPEGRVEAAVGRDVRQRKKMAIVQAAKGRAAISEYRTLESFRQHTLLEVHPLTGRTHQVRLHCMFLGCPIAGDRVYGKKVPTLSLSRFFLHARRLKILLPGAAVPTIFEAPLPNELLSVLNTLRKET